MDGEPLDEVDVATSGCASRRSARTPRASLRLCLNNTPLFQFGPLDQGWWPDGLYTAPDRRGAALRHRGDEAARLQHGAQARQGRARPLVLLVRQARPARLAGHAAARSCAARGTREIPTRQFERELEGDDRRAPQSPVHRHVGAVQRRLGTVRHAAHRAVDRSRTTRPGWSTTRAAGRTPRSATSATCIAIRAPALPKTEPSRAAVLGEFGGLGLPLAGHTWQSQANWSYRSFTTQRSSPTPTSICWRACIRCSDRRDFRPRSTRRRRTSRSRSTA